MDPRIKLLGVEFFINAINECLNVDLTITSNDVKLALTILYIAYKIKYSVQRMTSTTTSITSTSASGIRDKNVWNAIDNIGRPSTSVSSSTIF